MFRYHHVSRSTPDIERAIRFYLAIGCTLEKHVKDDAQHLERAQLAVRDTGLGMTQDEQTRLFQPFMQADNSTTRRFGGTGLGLVICKQLVERMGGKLWVDSEPGRGSTFHFNARFGRADAETQMAAPARAWTAAW